MQSRGHSLLESSLAASRNGEADLEKTRAANRRVWIKAAEMLVKSGECPSARSDGIPDSIFLGAHWDPAWRTPRGCSQLHLFLAAFPPSKEDSSTYRALLKSALESGLSPTSDDDLGRSALFVLCEQMAHVSSEVCADSSRVLHIVLEACGERGVGTADRNGRTVFDIDEKVAHSCLSACRQILLDASHHHRHVPLRSVARLPPAQPHHHLGDWELEKPRSAANGGIASVGSRDQNGHNGHASSGRQQASLHRYSDGAAKRKSSSADSFASSDLSSVARGRGNSYLLDNDDEEVEDRRESSSLRLSGLRYSGHR